MARKKPKNVKEPSVSDYRHGDARRKDTRPGGKWLEIRVANAD
ncbi:MAG: hypothetical protein ACOYU4_04830 [Thermodesulfobacteriota bacterium]